jgi:hypothetical protein
MYVWNPAATTGPPNPADEEHPAAPEVDR